MQESGSVGAPFFFRWLYTRTLSSILSQWMALTAIPGHRTAAIATLNVGSWQTWRRLVRNHKAGTDRFAYDRALSNRLAWKKKWKDFEHYFLTGKLEALDGNRK